MLVYIKLDFNLTCKISKRNKHMINWTDKQIEILKKAIELIPKKGLPSVTFKNLAKEFKLTEPARFRHFKSKKILSRHYITLQKKNFIKLKKCLKIILKALILNVHKLFSRRFRYAMFYAY